MIMQPSQGMNAISVEPLALVAGDEEDD